MIPAKTFMIAGPRLALGTAQLGQHYGVANRYREMSFDDAAAVVAEARAQGVTTIDTAVAYGASEERLGRIGVDGWQVVSKLPGLPSQVTDIMGWTAAEVRASLRRLRIGRLYGLLLHRPAELFGPRGDELYAALVALRSEGLVHKIGLSIYSPDELAVLERRPVDLVQCPFNLFDQRLARSGWLQRLRACGVELHARSVFLQGLLLMRERPRRFDRWESLWRRWDGWLEAHRTSALAACLRFVLSHEGIAKVVVGVDGPEQLRQIAIAAATDARWPRDLWCDDINLLNPSHWPAETSP